MSKLTAEQKILQKIVNLATGKTFTKSQEILDAFQSLVDNDEHFDAVAEVRGGFEYETDLPVQYSRHYEAKAVASRMLDGSWVGWTYFYGGGKHGEPSAVEWMEDAYDIEMTETQKMMTVREWRKIV